MIIIVVITMCPKNDVRIKWDNIYKAIHRIFNDSYYVFMEKKYKPIPVSFVEVKNNNFFSLKGI